MSPKTENPKEPVKLKAFTGESAPDVQDIDWLIQKFLARGAGTILSGQPGVSKTVHAAMICVCIWKGEDFAGLETRITRGRVLYVDVEKGWNWTAPYFHAAFRGAGIEGLPPEFHYYSPKTKACLHEGETGFITLETIGGLIAEYVEEHSIDLVVIDSFGQSFIGDQNSAQDVSIGFRMGLNPITRAGAAVLLIAHSTKGSAQGGTFAPTPAGSQQIRAWPVVSISLEQEGEKTEGRVRWSVDKTNSEPFKPFVTRLDFQSDSTGRLETITLEHEGDAGDRSQPEKGGGELAARRTILETLASGEQKRGQFARGGTFDRALKDLLEAGEVTKSARGMYSLPEIAPDSEPDDGPRDAPLEFAPPHQPLGNGVVVQRSEDLHQSLHQDHTKPVALGASDENLRVAHCTNSHHAHEGASMSAVGLFHQLSRFGVVAIATPDGFLDLEPCLGTLKQRSGDPIRLSVCVQNPERQKTRSFWEFQAAKNPQMSVPEIFQNFLVGNPEAERKQMGHKVECIQHAFISCAFNLQHATSDEARFANLGKITPSFDPRHVTAQIPLTLRRGVRNGRF